jgi:translation initiation factor IF-3
MDKKVLKLIEAYETRITKYTKMKEFFILKGSYIAAHDLQMKLEECHEFIENLKEITLI